MKTKKKLTVVLLALSILLGTASTLANISAEELTDIIEDGQEGFEIDPNLDTIPEDEEILEIELEEFKDNEVVDMQEEENQISTYSMSTLALTSNNLGIGSFNNKNINYNIYNRAAGGSKITYVNATRAYNSDAAVIDQSGNRYLIVIAGVEGWIDKEALHPYTTKEIKGLSHYSVNSSGDLYHYLSKNPLASSYSAINNGTAPSYLKKGVSYYSFDGHYFYGSADTMLGDYKAGNRNRSINPKDPFYNYFQFLPYRTQSKLTEADYNKFLANQGYTKQVEAKYKESNTYDVPANQSKLVGTAGEFIKQEKRFGANGALTFALAIHESGYGRSYLARHRNNLFGHAAYDSYPGSATAYSSTSEAIHAHNTRLLNWFYLDYLDIRNNRNWVYEGGMFGNKQTGINVHYASDAYWGEKAAAHMLNLDRSSGNKDYGNYTIGIKNDGDNVNIRKEPNMTSKIVSPSDVKGQSYVILGEVKGQSYNGSNKWYKIASDHLLDKNRDLLIFINNAVSREAAYDFNNSYVYIHSDFLDIAKIPNGTPVKPVEPTPPPKPTEPVKPAPGVSVKKGDVNGDGKISLGDLALVKSHLMNNRKLNKEEIVRADTNNDGKISLGDLAMIKGHLLGNIKLD